MFLLVLFDWLLFFGFVLIMESMNSVELLLSFRLESLDILFRRLVQDLNLFAELFDCVVNFRSV